MSNLKHKWTRTVYKDQVPMMFWSYISASITTSLVMQEYLLGRDLAAGGESLVGFGAFLRQVLPGAQNMTDVQLFDPLYLESFRTEQGVAHRFTEIKNMIQHVVHEVIFSRYDRTEAVPNKKTIPRVESFLKCTIIYHHVTGDAGGGHLSNLWMNLPGGFQGQIDAAMQHQTEWQAKHPKTYRNHAN